MTEREYSDTSDLARLRGCLLLLGEVGLTYDRGLAGEKSRLGSGLRALMGKLEERVGRAEAPALPRESS